MGSVVRLRVVVIKRMMKVIFCLWGLGGWWLWVMIFRLFGVLKVKVWFGGWKFLGLLLVMFGGMGWLVLVIRFFCLL